MNGSTVMPSTSCSCRPPRSGWLATTWSGTSPPRSASASPASGTTCRGADYRPALLSVRTGSFAQWRSSWLAQLRRGNLPDLHRLRQQLVEQLASEADRLIDYRAVAQHRLAVFVRGSLRFEDQAERDAVAPLVGLLQRGHEVPGIIARLILEAVDSLLEPGISV